MPLLIAKPKGTDSVSEHSKLSIKQLSIFWALLLAFESGSPLLSAQSGSDYYVKPLVQLSSQGRLLSPAAVYACSSLTKELKCLSAKADDTAHLSENPDAPIVSIAGRIIVKKEKALSHMPVDFYVADESSLLDDPRYRKLEVKDNQLDVPSSAQRVVLIGVYQEPSNSIKTKIVWLLGLVVSKK